MAAQGSAVPPTTGTSQDVHVTGRGKNQRLGEMAAGTFVIRK